MTRVECARCESTFPGDKMMTMHTHIGKEVLLCIPCEASYRMWWRLWNEKGICTIQRYDVIATADQTGQIKIEYSPTHWDWGTVCDSEDVEKLEERMISLKAEIAHLKMKIIDLTVEKVDLDE